MFTWVAIYEQFRTRPCSRPEGVPVPTRCAISGGNIMDSSPRGLRALTRFWSDEEGLVTLEWVALAAAVIVLAIGVISLLQTKVNTAASTIGSKIVSQVNSNS